MLGPQGFWQHRGQSQRDISCLTLSLSTLALHPPFPLPPSFSPPLLFILIFAFLSHSHFPSCLSVAELSLEPHDFSDIFPHLAWQRSSVLFPFSEFLSVSVSQSELPSQLDLTSFFLVQSAGLPRNIHNILSHMSNTLKSGSSLYLYTGCQRGWIVSPSFSSPHTGSSKETKGLSDTNSVFSEV